MDKLPFEIISQIFILAVFCNHDIPERLSHINQALRNVAMNTSLLWSHIYYIDGRDEDRLMHQTVLSGTVPISLELAITSQLLDDADLMLRIGDLISPNLQRMESLHIREFEGLKALSPMDLFVARRTRAVAEARVTKLFEQLKCDCPPSPSAPPPLLTSFAVNMRHLHWVPAFVSYWRRASVTHLTAVNAVGTQGCCQLVEWWAPTLQTIKLIFAGVGAGATGISPWTSLLNALTSLPALRELRITAAMSQRLADARLALSEGTVDLPVLELLYLGGHMDGFILSVRCPILSEAELDLNNFELAAPQGRDAAIAFLRNHPTLRSLKISLYQDSLAPDADPKPFTLPTLMHLDLSCGTTSARQLLRAMTVPALAHLKLALEYNTPLHPLREFFRSVAPTLQSITISSHHPISALIRTESPPTWPYDHLENYEFPMLETFVSQSPFGDHLFENVRKAPVLRAAEWYGNAGWCNFSDIDPGELSKLSDERLAIYLPSLSTISMHEVPRFTRRIRATAIRHINATAILLPSLSTPTIDRFQKIEWHLRQALYRLAALAFDSIESLFIAQPPSSTPISTPITPLTDLFQMPFPKLSCLSVRSLDAHLHILSAPNLKQLELHGIRSRDVRNYPASILVGFSNVETLVLSFDGDCDARSIDNFLLPLTNVSHLRLCVDPYGGNLVSEYRFLSRLQKSVRIQETMTFDGLPMDDHENASTRLFPKLDTIDIHFRMPEANEGLMGLPYGYADETPSEVASYTPSELDFSSDPAEYNSHSSQWSESGWESDWESDEGNGVIHPAVGRSSPVPHARAVPASLGISVPIGFQLPSTDPTPSSSRLFDDPTPDDPASIPLPASGSTAYASSESSSESEHQPARDVHTVYQHHNRETGSTEYLRFSMSHSYPNSAQYIHRAYEHVLQSLQDLVLDRSKDAEVPSLRAIRITAEAHVQDDLSPPDGLRDWFESHVPYFEAPLSNEWTT